MPDDDEYCFREHAFFPRGHFRDHPTYGRVHWEATPRHTVAGDDLEPLEDPAFTGAGTTPAWVDSGLPFPGADAERGEDDDEQEVTGDAVAAVDAGDDDRIEFPCPKPPGR